MQTLKLVLSDSQYEQLRQKAKEWHTSINDLVLEAVETFLRAEVTESRYTRLAHKQAMWRKRIDQEEKYQFQPDLAGTLTVREQPGAYTTEKGQSVQACLDNLRLDLVYHSEALEGSPLTKAQVEEAIVELSPQ